MSNAVVTSKPPSLQSRFALNSLNFFIAEVVAVALPFVNDFLKDSQWRYDSIGFAAALGAFGTFLAQTPAGVLIDRVQKKRALLAAASIAVGICYFIFPSSPDYPWAVYALLFFSGVASAFFGPLLGTLALSLVGTERFGATLGMNQAWSHVGNIAVAVVTMAVAQYYGIRVVFYTIGFVSIIAAICLIFIRGSELNKGRPASAYRKFPKPILKKSALMKEEPNSSQLGNQWEEFKDLFRNREIRILLISIICMHLANAPVLPLVALNLRAIGGTDQDLALLVFISQFAMIPIAWIAGTYCQNYGRKPFFALAFLLLPIRILLYAFIQNPKAFLAIQLLDGIGNGIYGVIIILVCNDLTRGKNTFNSLVGMTATTLALGGIIGPLAQGMITQHLGFVTSYVVFAAVAVIGAIFFLLKMPETAPRDVT